MVSSTPSTVPITVTTTEIMSELKIVPRSFQRNVYAAVEYVSGKSLYPYFVIEYRGGNGNHKDVEHRNRQTKESSTNRMLKQAFVVGLIWFKRNAARASSFSSFFFFGLYLMLFCQSHLCVLPSSNNRAFSSILETMKLATRTVAQQHAAWNKPAAAVLPIVTLLCKAW